VGARRLAAFAAIAGLGALLFSSSAQACSCLQRTPREAFREADAAIVGRLVEAVPLDAHSAEYRYRVRRAYKAGTGIRAGEEVAVRSGIGGASCGLPRDEERWYGLFLYRSAGRWSGGSCGLLPPRRLAAAAAAVRRSDPGAAAAAGKGDVPTTAGAPSAVCAS
jgi:hypothetical protein